MGKWFIMLRVLKLLFKFKLFFLKVDVYKLLKMVFVEFVFLFSVVFLIVVLVVVLLLFLFDDVIVVLVNFENILFCNVFNREFCIVLMVLFEVSVDNMFVFKFGFVLFDVLVFFLLEEVGNCESKVVNIDGKFWLLFVVLLVWVDLVCVVFMLVDGIDESNELMFFCVDIFKVIIFFYL